MTKIRALMPSTSRGGQSEQSGPAGGFGHILVWVIDPGLPGETNQCLGVALALARRATVRIELVKLRLRSNALAPLFYLALRAGLISRGAARRPRGILSRMLFSGPSLAKDLPAITVSTLGRGEVPALLMHELGSHALHIGLPRRVASNHLDLVIHLPSQDAASVECATVAIDIVPTPILLDDVRAHTSPLVTEWCGRNGRLFAALIGGDGSGYTYRREEWRQFASSIKQLARKLDANILLTTSRRTGAVAEKVLKANLSDFSNLAHAGWFGDKSQSTMKDYLAAAKFVICTEESRSMISDAIAAGKCVYTVRPELDVNR
jgi:mitochondrial fission protein ELM1